MRKVWFAVIPIVMVAIGGPVAILVALQPPAPRSPLPAASTPVTVVVRDYLKAARDHDCGYTRELTAYNEGLLCDNLVSYWNISKPYQVAVDGTCFDFDMQNTETDDGSLAASKDEPWGLCFKHLHGRWLVSDSGTG